MIPPKALTEVARSAAAEWSASQAAAAERFGIDAPARGDQWGFVVEQVLAALPRFLADDPRLLAHDSRFTSQGWEGVRQRAIDTILFLHQPRPLYRECHCEEDAKDDGRHVEVEEVGLTCEVAEVVCSYCCCDGDGNQAEHCAESHTHAEDYPICPTVSAITAGGMCLCTADQSPFCPLHGDSANHGPHPVAVVIEAKALAGWRRTAQEVLPETFEKFGMPLVAPEGKSLDQVVGEVYRELASGWSRQPRPDDVWAGLVEAGVRISRAASDEGDQG